MRTGRLALSRSRKKGKQAFYLDDAVRFFEWCKSNLYHYTEKLNAEDKKDFESGKMPKNLFEVVHAAWSDDLKNHLPWNEHFAVIRKVLTNPLDYDRWMNCSMHELRNLPKRIRAAVADGEKSHGKKLHEAFFKNEGETRLAEYLRVWQSQGIAMNKLMFQALGYKRKEGGGASIGSTQYDFESALLANAAATGSAMKVRGLILFLRSLWEADKTVYVRTATGYEPKTVPNPDMSEARLNRFLIKLGRALASTKKRGNLPDWIHGVDQTERFIVEGWCKNIIVDDESWPMLCFFTTPALVRFLRLCKVTHCKLGTKNERTLERSIQRMGLVRISRGRINHVEKRGGRFYFT